MSQNVHSQLLEKINANFNRIATNVLQADLTEDQVTAAYNQACSNNRSFLASLNPINRTGPSSIYTL